jgi:predicted DsbA family dithiol-disulfide isomerase
VDLEVVQAGSGAEVTPAPEPPEPPDAVFWYDLASPDCYLVAERIRAELPVVCDWEPVHAALLGLPDGSEGLDREAFAAAAAALELLPLRLPAVWPPDSALAMRVATYAKGAGKSIAFSLAAFRQAFAGGRDLSDEATVLLAAAACEIHPTAALKGAGLRSTAAALAGAGQRARAAGVTALPAFALPGGTTVCGPRALDEAIAALSLAD